MQVQIGDMVRIDCASSKYNGVIGSVLRDSGNHRLRDSRNAEGDGTTD